MPVDTSEFDQKISDLQIQIDTKSSALDADPDNVKLKILQDKATEIQDITFKRTDTENKKSQFISIKNSIDTKTQEIVDLNKQADNLRISIE